MNNYSVTIGEETLSDGSLVFCVNINNQEGHISFDCVSENQAMLLAAELDKTLNQYLK